MPQVKHRQTRAAREHARHACHRGGVEMTQVEVCQSVAVIEHIIHTGHLTGVQMLHALDGLKMRHAIKPAVGGRRAGISERRVKHHSSHIGFGAIGVPTGIVVIGIQKVGSARADIAIVVVVERQRRVI